MGLFSSIGNVVESVAKPIGNIVSSVASPFVSGASALLKSPVVGDLASGGLGVYGANKTNELNLDMSRENMAFQDWQAQRSMDWQSKEAKRQMDFQSDQSSTAYQRAMKDMKKAGLNPMLAFSQGGASTPTGASGGGAQGHGAQMTFGDAINTGISSAMQIKRLKADLKNLNSTNDLIKANTEASKADALLKVNSAKNVELLRPELENRANISKSELGKGASLGNALGNGPLGHILNYFRNRPKSSEEKNLDKKFEKLYPIK